MQFQIVKCGLKKTKQSNRICSECGEGINFGQQSSLRTCYLKRNLNIEKEILILEEKNSRQT